MKESGRRTKGSVNPAPAAADTMPPPVLCLVGESGVGKTQVLVSLVAELSRRGYRVATIKHVGDHDFDIDRPGKDSWRYAEAGSGAVAISSPQRLAILRKTSDDTPLEEIVTSLGPEFDLVLAEGYKNQPGAKIEVHRRARGHTLISNIDELVAVVVDERLELAVPQYHFDDDIGITDLVEEWLQRSSNHD
jgi:molybdopterin-guanine dinucleotide biosynthesis protein B